MFFHLSLFCYFFQENVFSHYNYNFSLSELILNNFTDAALKQM